VPTAPTRAWTLDDPTPRGLWDLLGHPGAVTLVGAGGKTTLAHALADEAAACGARVLLTTTTHMEREPGLITDPAEALRQLQHDESPLKAPKVADLAPVAPLRTLSSSSRSHPGHVVLAGRETDDAMFTGPADVDRQRRAADVTVIEGDGSRRLPFKVPAAHEPVVPAWTDLLVIVTGASALGRPLGEVCCRVEVTSRLLDDPDAAGRVLDPALAARLLRAGYLDNPALAAWSGRRAVVVNQVDDDPLGRLGRELASLLPGETLILSSNRQPHDH
jgi:probable selenium-dependent hydroxylase accessory protein YqeC